MRAIDDLVDAPLGGEAGGVLGDEPQRAPGIGAARHPRHARVQLADAAVGGDDQIVRPEALALRGHQPPPCPVELRRRHRHATAQLGARRLQRRQQHAEQRAAMDAEADEPRIDRRVRQIDQRPAAGEATRQPIDGRAVSDHLVEHAEHVQRRLPRRLQRDARAYRARRDDALEHGDDVALPRQQRRRRRPRGARSDHRDAQTRRHRRSLQRIARRLRSAEQNDVPHARIFDDDHGRCAASPADARAPPCLQSTLARCCRRKATAPHLPPSRSERMCT